MIDLDLSLPVNQVRVLIGDIDGSFISDDNIEFVLTDNNGDVIAAATYCLKIILNMVATYVREETGDVEVWWSDLYNQLSERYDDLKKENRYKNSSKMFFFGGTVKSEAQRVRASDENTQRYVTNERFQRIYDCLGEYVIPKNGNPFYLQC